jgi:hypothetical protein
MLLAAGVMVLLGLQPALLAVVVAVVVLTVTLQLRRVPQ